MNVIIIIIVLFLIYVLLTNLYILGYGKEYIYELKDLKKVKKADYIIVPGAQIFSDQPSNTLKDRMDTAIDIFNVNKSKEIFLSGAYEEGPDRHEVNLMNEYLMKNGIPEENITQDFKGLNTYKTMYRAKSYYEDKTAIICTQRMFANRTLYLARKLGINACVIISNKHEHYSNEKFMFCREIGSRAKAVFNINIYAPRPVGITKSNLK